MSLGIVFKGSEGLVLAADSRVTLTTKLATGEVIMNYFDNATKLLKVPGHDYVAMVTYGAGAIGQSEPRTAHSYLPELQTHLQSDRLTVKEFARHVGDFYLQRWIAAGMPAPITDPNMQALYFLVAGYDDGEPYGTVYQVVVPSLVQPIELNPGIFGMNWGGQSQPVERLINGADPSLVKIAQDSLSLDVGNTTKLVEAMRNNLGLRIPYQFLPLQDCVDLSTFLVNMTSAVQTWTVGISGVGGAVDVATITRTDGFQALKEKRVQLYE